MRELKRMFLISSFETIFSGIMMTRSSSIRSSNIRKGKWSCFRRFLERERWTNRTFPLNWILWVSKANSRTGSQAYLNRSLVIPVSPAFSLRHSTSRSSIKYLVLCLNIRNSTWTSSFWTVAKKYICLFRATISSATASS